MQGHIRPGLFAGVYSPVGRLHGLELINRVYPRILAAGQKEKPPD